MDWKLLYDKAHREWQQRTAPNFVRDHGYVKTKFPKTDTSNGLTRMIKEWCIWNGHAATRVNSQGQMRIEKVKLAFGNVRENIRWTKGQSKGASDLDITLKHPHHKFGIPVKVEIKIGSDTQRKEQEQYEEQVTGAGAVYKIIKTPEQWFEFYFKIMS